LSFQLLPLTFNLCSSRFLSEFKPTTGYVAPCPKVKSPKLHISLSSLLAPSLVLNVAFAFDTLSSISKMHVALAWLKARLRQNKSEKLLLINLCLFCLRSTFGASIQHPKRPVVAVEFPAPGDKPRTITGPIKPHIISNYFSFWSNIW